MDSANGPAQQRLPQWAELPGFPVPEQRKPVGSTAALVAVDGSTVAVADGSIAVEAEDGSTDARKH